MYFIPMLGLLLYMLLLCFYYDYMIDCALFSMFLSVLSLVFDCRTMQCLRCATMVLRWHSFIVLYYIKLVFELNF